MTDRSNPKNILEWQRQWQEQLEDALQGPARAMEAVFGPFEPAIPSGLRELEGALPDDPEPAQALPEVETLGQRIRRLRKAQGWTQAVLADKAGLSIDSIKDYEAGRTTPKAFNRKVIEDVFRASEETPI